MLPAIYRRYDAPSGDIDDGPDHQGKGVLRRYLELTGGQLDQLYSLARAALDLHDLDRVDGRLLPILAQWIGWRTDHRLAVRDQRREIRFAPAIYQRIGTFDAIDATARRVTGMQVRAKEFVHNIARANQPEQLMIWSVFRRDPGSDWSTPVLVSPSVAFDGRPAHIRAAADDMLFFHTHRVHGWGIWAKRLDGDGVWSASVPVVETRGDARYPAAARVGNRTWLCWESYDPDERAARRRIALRNRADTDSDWSEIVVSGGPGGEFAGAGDTERRRPAVAADGAGGLWLFWQELSGDHWEIRYNRHDGTRWQLTAPKTLPQNADERIAADMSVLVRPSGADRRLWLFGARQVPGGLAGEKRWSVTYRVKNALDPNETSDWSPPRLLPKPAATVHDREPAPLLRGDRIELFFSSTRPTVTGEVGRAAWSIHRTELLDPATNTWADPRPVATGAAGRRASLAFGTSTGTVLTYRAGDRLAPDGVSAAGTDSTAAGTTTFHGTRPVSYGTFDDTQTYTYTAAGGGVAGDGRFARDAVGLFLIPPQPGLPPEQLAAATARLASVAAEFLPVNARAILIQH
nr:phage tail protein [Nocardia bovistercoris]